MLVELVLFVALLFLLWKTLKKPSGLPPGRWGLPLVGYIPLTTKSMEQQVMDLHKKHGSIVLWRIGTQPMVFVNDYKLIKEAFFRLEFTDRPDWEALKLLEDTGYGIAGSNGIIWHNNRRFTLRQLRDLGMGKSNLVLKIQDQALKLRDAIAEEAGTPVEIPEQLFVAIINVVWQMAASTQFEPEDERCKEFIDLMSDIPLVINYLSIKDLMPWLQNVMPDFVLKRIIKYHEASLMIEKFLKYFYEEIEKHRSTLDPDNPRDLIDGYLLDMEEKKDDPDTTCSDRDLVWILFNLFFAGSDTTFVTFHWMCCYLAAHPRVQQKMHAEIDSVLPKGTLPTIEEKNRMPYVEATINEVMRVCSLVNFGLQHMASSDTVLGGFTIPKGTVLCSSATSIHYDDRYWDRPEEFLPERWLDVNGKFTMKKEGFLPFGVGKRLCVGEGLARMEMFIFTTIVLQSFSISPLPGKTVNLAPDLSEFFIRKPSFNQFIFTNRN